MKKLLLAACVALGVSNPAHADVGPTHTQEDHTETLHIFIAGQRPDGSLVYPPAIFTYQVTPWTCTTGSPEMFYVGDGNLPRGYTAIYIRWCE